MKRLCKIFGHKWKEVKREIVYENKEIETVNYKDVCTRC